LVFSQIKNRTLVGLVSTKDKEQVELYTFAINNFFIPFVSFATIVICTIILSLKLQRTAEWRKSTISITPSKNVSTRNTKAAKMVVMISTLFIACYIPITIFMLAVGFEPEMSLNGKYFNIAVVIGSFAYIMESINSSMNIFIYYSMSSRYRYIFVKCFSFFYNRPN
jgi:hypothetical protein